MHLPDRKKMALITMEEIIYSQWAVKVSAFTEVMSSERGKLAGSELNIKHEMFENYSEVCERKCFNRKFENQSYV